MKQILRKQEVGFTQIKNEIAIDKNLSWKAKGLFLYLYSKPDDWNFAIDRIVKESKDGIRATREGLKELEKNGYLKRQKRQDGKMEYYIRYNRNFTSPKPQSAIIPICQSPNVLKRHSAKMSSYSNIDSTSNKEEDSNNKEKEINKEKESPFFSNPIQTQNQPPPPQEPPNSQEPINSPNLSTEEPTDELEDSLEDYSYQPSFSQEPSCELPVKISTQDMPQELPKEWLPAYCRDILIDLNSKLGTDYKPIPAVKRLIRDRWKEGYREIEQYKTVHTNMIQAWYKDPKMKHNLNPTTLYSEKFQNYLNWTKIKTQKTFTGPDVIYNYNGDPIKPLTPEQRKARDERYEKRKQKSQELGYKEIQELSTEQAKEKQNRQAEETMKILENKKIKINIKDVPKILDLFCD